MYEVEFEVKDPPPVRYLEKGWNPEPKRYRKTMLTGKIVAVLQGKARVGDPAPADSTLSRLSKTEWRRLFASKGFRALEGGIEDWMAIGGGYTDAWGGGSNICFCTRESASVCKCPYDKLKREILRCLQPVQRKRHALPTNHKR